MKLLSCLILFLAYHTAQAGRWIPVNSYLKNATDITEITLLTQRFPKIMDGRSFQLVDIHRLQVSLVSLEYKGETTCPIYDTRLKREHLSYFICLKQQAGPCLDHVDEVPSDQDPCLN